MSPHVLIVDDNPQNRMLVTAQLSAAGYRVSEAESGFAALEAIERGELDLVLLDVMMPGMDGFEVCRRVRELPQGSDLPVVFLTALSDHETHEQALAVGVDDFLGKPINRTELLIRVRSLIRIARLQRDLRREHDSLLHLQKQKDLLSTLLVHDLKNPLASILSNAEYVLVGPDFATDSRDAVRDILAAAGTMHQMVLNLLDISLAEDGSLVPVLVDVDVRLLVVGARERMKRRFDATSHRFEMRMAGELVVRADPSMLDRVLENLLDNALRHAPRGTTITVEVGARDGELQITVRDEGRGVPAPDRELLFDKYAQAEREDQGRKSRGLGLVFCRLAVEAHGGRISVEDNVPRGASFRISLPIRSRDGGR